jgi:hypothetical protein
MKLEYYTLLQNQKIESVHENLRAKSALTTSRDLCELNYYSAWENMAYEQVIKVDSKTGTTAGYAQKIKRVI